MHPGHAAINAAGESSTMHSAQCCQVSYVSELGPEIVRGKSRTQRLCRRKRRKSRRISGAA
eukprot:887015-Rhodomonas_salina.1